MAGVLPIPMPIPVPVRARPPRYFYQPIAPRTPRGPVAIPVAAPPVFGALMGDEGPRPRRGLRPEQPRVPRQPGLAAPIEPIPIAVNPRAPREDRGIRPGEPPRMRPRPSLPSRPIPFPQAGQRCAIVRPGERPDRDRGPRPDRPDPGPREVRPTAPVRDAARSPDPRLDAGEILPRQPRPQSPRIEIERERPGRGDVGRDPRIRPEPQAPVRRPASQCNAAAGEERRPRREGGPALGRRVWSLAWSGATRPLSSRARCRAWQEAAPPGARLPRAAATAVPQPRMQLTWTGPSRAGSLRRRAAGRRQCRALPARAALRYRRVR